MNVLPDRLWDHDHAVHLDRLGVQSWSLAESRGSSVCGTSIEAKPEP